MAMVRLHNLGWERIAQEFAVLAIRFAATFAKVVLLGIASRCCERRLMAWKIGRANGFSATTAMPMSFGRNWRVSLGSRLVFARLNCACSAGPGN